LAESYKVDIVGVDFLETRIHIMRRKPETHGYSSDENYDHRRGGTMRVLWVGGPRCIVAAVRQSPTKISVKPPDGGYAMRKPLRCVFLMSLLLPSLATAQSAFDGTWKFDMKTAQFSEKPDVYLYKMACTTARHAFP
jgi:hypothetical protein